MHKLFSGLSISGWYLWPGHHSQLGMLNNLWLRRVLPVPAALQKLEFWTEDIHRCSSTSSRGLLSTGKDLWTHKFIKARKEGYNLCLTQSPVWCKGNKPFFPTVFIWPRSTIPRGLHKHPTVRRGVPGLPWIFLLHSGMSQSWDFAWVLGQTGDTVPAVPESVLSRIQETTMKTPMNHTWLKCWWLATSGRPWLWKRCLRSSLK